MPVDALTSPPWLPVWDKLRSDQGLTCSGYTSPVYPIMPAPAMSRGWSQAALGVTAAGEWLRNLLRRTETVGSIRIATRSLKATLLAWCAKAAISHDDRRLLGYHTASSDASMLVYSSEKLGATALGGLKKFFFLSFYHYFIIIFSFSLSLCSFFYRLV